MNKLWQKKQQKVAFSKSSFCFQAMYFGLSFSRVGFDFRPLLAPIFEKRILAQFNKLICWDNNAKVTFFW